MTILNNVGLRIYSIYIEDNKIVKAIFRQNIPIEKVKLHLFEINNNIMGKFKKWMEGWGIDYDQIPSDLADQYGNLKAKKAAKKQVINSLYQSPFISFDAEKDRPEDFVKIEPLMQAKSLPQFNIPGKQILPSWEGATIYYGFKFSTPQERMSQERRDQVLTLKKELQELKRQLKKATMQILNKRQREIVDEEWDKMRQKEVMPPELIAKYLPQFVNRRLEAEGATRLSWKKIESYLKKGKEKGDSAYKIRKIIKEKETILKELESELENKNTFLNAIEQAFLKKMKHPTLPADHEFSQNFIKTAVDHFVRLSNTSYDYVLYPESSSDMNERLALEIASKINAEPIKGFQKLEEPTIDTHNYAQINKPDPEQQGLGGPESPQYRNMYGPRGLQNTVQSSKGQIKNVTYGKQFRPYVRNWRMEPGLKGSAQNQTGIGLKGKRLLVIDDNVDSGGTFQAINHILVKYGPRRIDYYAPIVANFHS